MVENPDGHWSQKASKFPRPVCVIGAPSSREYGSCRALDNPRATATRSACSRARSARAVCLQFAGMTRWACSRRAPAGIAVHTSPLIRLTTQPARCPRWWARRQSEHHAETGRPAWRQAGRRRIDQHAAGSRRQSCDGGLLGEN